ncbi:MAG: hypothetical protein IJZ86_06265 [Bacteroides sp.]|nr:hypothetical protein [Bacteroides sp.]
MKLRLLTSFLFLLFLTTGICQAKDKDEFRYDIESAGSGTQGTDLVQVWVYSKKGKTSDDDLKKAAVHGVIFRGFNGMNGLPSQRPLVKSITAEEQHKDYFNALFNGAHLHFASIVSGSYKRVRTSNKEYKVGVTIQVNRNALRKELENAGIIKKLSSGF